MARWLLMAQDRAGREEFPITHEFLSELLGVRRQTVSIIAGTLQRAGLITYRRGVLRVLDREGLEAASCECYEVLKRLYDRIMEC
jgi:Mn-dependent DtxR family transcriptional regulator